MEMETRVEETQEVKDLRGVVRRRRKGFITAFVAVFFAGLIIAFALPPIYLSESTILIEEQQIPADFVKTTITSYVEERLQMITQQIMSRSKLLDVINRFGLYPEMRDRYTTEDIIEEMREDIRLETISADVIDKRTGRPSAATIAFKLSYEGKDPTKVQQVANVLASLYLEENLKAREQQASNTTAFLDQERDQLKTEIEDLENKITEFKKAHLGELPEHSAVNLQQLSRLSRDIDQMSAQLRTLQERKIYLEGQLVGMDPLSPIVTEEGKTIMNPKERLKLLRLQLVSLQSSLSERHPDVKKLKSEIQELETQVGDSDDSVEKLRRLEDLKGKLAEMKGKLGPKHPDVVKLTREVEALSEEVKGLEAKKAGLSLAQEKPDNPAYINLRTQLASVEMEIKSLLQERAKLNKEMNQYQVKLANAPLVEKRFNELTRDYENAKIRYNEIMNKLMEARVAQGMEETQRGERFTIIDPAQFPEKPHKPNRLAIMLISLVLALGAGVGLAAARESLDQSVKSPEELTGFSGEPVLSVIPFMQTDQERRAKALKKALWIFVVLGAVAAALIVIHIFVMPLDILWLKLERRFTLGLGI